MRILLAALMLINLSNVLAQGGDRADHAGNGSSGGGHIYGDQLNPWFLENTKVVNYCVEVSSEFSDLEYSKILESIEYALAYWKKIFNSYSGNIYTKLNTQEFIYSTQCLPTTDIKFQMGTLSEDQKKQINYHQLIGLAQRTNYDRKNLKAQGFIYIAPERGELRPQSTLIHPKPWSTGDGKFALRVALIHELGHVFGLQDDYYYVYGIMGATIVDRYIRKEMVQIFAHKEFISPPSVFGCNKDYEGSLQVKYSSKDVDPVQMLQQHIRDYLGIKNGDFELDIETKSKKINIKIDDKNFGYINLNQAGTSPYNITPAIQLYLTKEQTVFKNLPDQFYNNFLSLYYIEVSTNVKNVMLHLNDGREMNVFVNFDRICSPTIGTIFNNEVIFDIFLGN